MAISDGLLVFFAAVFFLLITPGPGVLTAAGVGAAFGASPGYRYLAGLFIGANLVALAVVSGLAALVLTLPGLQIILLVASGLYLTYLAFRLALAGSEIAFMSSSRAPGFLNGIALQTINPKAYVVNTTLFTGFAFEAHSAQNEILIKLLIINMVWIPIHLLWLSAGIYLQQLNLPARHQRVINILMAISLLLVVALAALAGKST